MNMVVLGAGGTLGRLVRAELVTRGHRVVAIPRGEARDPAAIARSAPGVIVDCAGASTALALGKGWRGFRAVDTPIGLAAVEAARRCGARMVYVGTHYAAAQRGTPYVTAHERVVEAMRAVDGCVVRATGFFSVFLSFLPMAQRGFLLDVGTGRARTNPIDERDLADVVVDAALGDGPRVLAAGGPDVMTRREIYEQVASLVQRRVRIVGIPTWIARIGAMLLRPLHPRIAQFAAFACGLARHDVIAPVLGTRRFADYATVAA
jgi:uncharacterized protein YbjT (DUF2867 family)